MTSPSIKSYEVDKAGIDWAIEQEAFERWYVSTQTKRNYRRLCKLPTGVYVDLVVLIAWRAWRQSAYRAENIKRLSK